MTIALNLSPSPVLTTTPTIIPAAAQVAATFSIWPEPSRSAAITLRHPIAVSRRRSGAAEVEGGARRAEDGKHRREAPDHERDDRHERNEVIPVAFGQQTKLPFDRDRDI